MMNISGKKLSIVLMSSAISSIAFGNGFALNEQNASSLGQAFAGRASDANDASTISGNPAGLSYLKQAELSGGFALIDAHAHISDASATKNSAPQAGSNDGDPVPKIKVPFAYYAHPIDEHLAVGFGLYAPFGLTTDYETGFQGSYFGTKSELKVITAQPTISYKLDNGLAFGLGVTYNRITGELDKTAPSGGSDVIAKVNGDDTAWGYNVGVLYQVNENTRIGLTYFSRVDYTLEGHTSLLNFPGSNQRYKASLDLKTPDKIDFGFTHQLSPKLAVHGDITRTDWGTLREIKVTNENPIVPQLATDSETLKWNKSWFYSLGLSYELNPQWTLRSGVAFDQSPIPDSNRNVRVPSNNRTELAIGTTWSPTEKLSVDFAYLHFRERPAEINQAGASTLTGTTYTYQATYHNFANIFGVQLNWKI